MQLVNLNDFIIVKMFLIIEGCHLFDTIWILNYKKTEPNLKFLEINEQQKN